ncbi:hypothetical protein TrVGV298_000740 [Trichoderma virens]|nr:hypothetical protein TrVGV298_000740 [Trichoderma virens]
MAMSPHAGTQCLENAPPVRFWSSMAVVSMWTITAALWSITQGLLTQARRAVAGTRTCTYPELHAVATCMQAASARLLRVRLAICIVSPLNQTTYYYTRYAVYVYKVPGRRRSGTTTQERARQVTRMQARNLTESQGQSSA